MLKNIGKEVLHLGWDGKTIDLAPGETIEMKAFGTKDEKEEHLLEGRFVNILGPGLARVTKEEAAPEEEAAAPEESQGAAGSGSGGPGEE